MRTIRVALWIGCIAAAALAGGLNAWIVGIVHGGVVSVTVDDCYRYYDQAETAHTRCEGFWRTTPEGRTADVVRGPVAGVPVDPSAPLTDPASNPTDFGYKLSIRPDTYLATLNGDTATIIPTSRLVLGSTAIVIVVLCAAGSRVLTRRLQNQDSQELWTTARSLQHADRGGDSQGETHHSPAQRTR